MPMGLSRRARCAGAAAGRSIRYADIYRAYDFAKAFKYSPHAVSRPGDGHLRHRRATLLTFRGAPFAAAAAIAVKPGVCTLGAPGIDTG